MSKPPMDQIPYAVKNCMISWPEAYPDPMRNATKAPANFKTFNALTRSLPESCMGLPWPPEWPVAAAFGVVSAMMASFLLCRCAGVSYLVGFGKGCSRRMDRKRKGSADAPPLCIGV